MLMTSGFYRRRRYSFWAGLVLLLVFVGSAAADAAGQEAPAAKQPVASPLCDTAGLPDGVPVNGLQIAVATDKSVYRAGEQIHLSIRFINRGDRIFRIFDSNGFWSADIILQDGNGNEVPWRGGYVFFSPKVDVYPGTTRELAPGRCFEKRLRAWVDPGYRVVFGEPERNRAQPLSRETRARLGVPDGLPDEFVGTGRIFELTKPGTYRLRFHYEKTAMDGRVWKIDSDPDKNAELLRDVWTGAIDSNPTMIEVK